VLELGGSDPAIVLADADLEKAADTITLSRIINAGQSCIAAKRIIVEASSTTDMVDLLEKKLGALRTGRPARGRHRCRADCREDLRDNLHRQVSETIDAGARCLLGGELPEG
jgi:succinate-semialdehyde dehydrogenase / glutarate-semialdehyde dehydrogenase